MDFEAMTFRHGGGIRVTTKVKHFYDLHKVLRMDARRLLMCRNMTHDAEAAVNPAGDSKDGCALR